VIDPIPGEFRLIVLRIIQTYDTRHTKMTKNLQIVFWCIPMSILTLVRVNRSHKSYKLVGNNPVEISILHLLIVLILFVIKCVQIVPSMAYRLLQPLQTVKHSALVRALTVASISEGFQLLVIGGKRCPSSFS